MDVDDLYHVWRLGKIGGPLPFFFVNTNYGMKENQFSIETRWLIYTGLY